MEENNGRTVEPKGSEFNDEMSKLNAENIQLKQLLKQAVEEIQQLRQAWLWKRIDVLLEIIKCESFNAEFKVRAIEEIEDFLYSKQEETTEPQPDNKN